MRAAQHELQYVKYSTILRSVNAMRRLVVCSLRKMNVNNLFFALRQKPDVNNLRLKKASHW